MTGKSLSFALEDSKKETSLKEMMKKEAEDKLYSTQGNCANLMVTIHNRLTQSNGYRKCSRWHFITPLPLLGSSQYADPETEGNGGFIKSGKIPQIETARGTDQPARRKIKFEW